MWQKGSTVLLETSSLVVQYLQIVVTNFNSRYNVPFKKKKEKKKAEKKRKKQETNLLTKMAGSL